MSLVLPFLVAVANVMGAGMIVPQVIRLHRLKCAQGVSGVWVGVGAVMNLWWVAYALATEVWAVLPVGIAGSVLYLTIAAQYAALVGTGAWRTITLGSVGLGIVPIPALALGGWNAAGLALGLLYGLQFLPAAIAAFSSRNPLGVSPLTWSMAWIEAGVWLVYGAVIADHALFVGGGGGLIVASVILGRLTFLNSSRSHPGLTLSDR